MDWSMLMRFPSVSKNETCWSTPRYLQGLARYIATGLGYLSHRGLNVVDRDHYVRILHRPVRPLREEAAIDRAWITADLIRAGSITLPSRPERCQHPPSLPGR